MKKQSNKTSGNRFEQEFAKVLYQHGYWVHVMQQNKDGQPADIIAIKGSYHVLIDCKEVNTKNGFVLTRVEENQRLAMNLFRSRCKQLCWFAVKFQDGTVRMISLANIEDAEKKGIKAITDILSQQFMTDEEWIYVMDATMKDGDTN